MLTVDYIVNSIFNSRTYILSETGSDKVWLVDCGDVEPLLSIVGGRKVEGVLLTHTHSDHIYGLPLLLNIFPNISIVTNKYGRTALSNPKLNISRYHSEYEDIVISCDNNVIIAKEEDEFLGLRVYETPGHDPSCLTYSNENFIFTGDSYIPGTKVFCGFPNSNKEQAEYSKERILQFAKGKNIFPGHSL